MKITASFHYLLSSFTRQTMQQTIQQTRQLAGWKKALAVSFLLLLMFFSAGCSMSSATRADNLNAENRETVVLLHGLGRSSTAMWLLASRIEDAGYNVQRIDYDSFRTSPEQIIKSVEQDLAACCNPETGKVHFVGHSLGGLIIRAYLDRHPEADPGRVVLIGTPNHGTDFVDNHKDRWWMQLAGETALSLGTDINSFPNSLPVPDYSVGVIAAFRPDSMEQDGIPGADDGLVPVHSTFLKGMSDFLLVETGHSAMRYDKTIAEQTIYYLRYGHFLHSADDILSNLVNPEKPRTGILL